MNQRREDWQDWHTDHNWHHQGWYHGYWHGHWGGWWDHMWDDHPLAAAMGVTWWGVNRLSTWYGFPWYYNPYYVAPAQPTVINYSEPPVIVYEEAAAALAPPDPAQSAPSLPPGVTQAGVEKFDQARAAFYEGKYEEALKLTDEALVSMPRDALIHEFRALVLFALKRYPEAAAVIHAVLAVGPGWDATTMTSLYPGIESTYTPQLRALEAYRNEAPTRPAGRFLLAYHYLTLGHQEAAVEELRAVCKAQPKDTVAAELLRTISPEATKPAVAAAGDVKPIPPEQVIGTWTAAGPGKAQYTMTLNKDGAFTWSYVQGTRKQQVKGVYTVDGGSLVMEPGTGGVLLADLKFTDANAMQFQVVGAPKDDPGLGFRRDK